MASTVSAAATARKSNCRPYKRICSEPLYATGKPVVFVNCSGSAIAMPWAAKHLPAILQAWYPGEEGGRAVAEVLFGDVNPAGPAAGHFLPFHERPAAV